MGKKNDFNEMGNLLEEKKKLDRKIKRAAIACSHLGKNGKVKFDIDQSTGQCVCKRCGTKFNFAQYSAATANECIKGVHDIINQIKVFTDDPDEDAGLIRTLGEIDYNLQTVKELYNRLISDGKHNKKKKNSNDYGSFGNIGRDLSFVSGGKKKKNRW